MSGGNDFEAVVARFQKRVVDRVDAVVRKIALDALREIVLATPVDTGRARGNWIVTLDAPAKHSTLLRDPGGGRAIAEGTDVIMGKAGGRDVTIYIINNLVYIRVLEFGLYPNPPKRGTYVPSGKTRYGVTGPGWARRSVGGFSRQAPRGMVRVTVQRIRSQMPMIIRAIKGGSR